MQPLRRIIGLAICLVRWSVARKLRECMVSQLVYKITLNNERNGNEDVKLSSLIHFT